jgi:hypothetical protein
MNYCSIEDAWGNDFNNNIGLSYSNYTPNIIENKQMKTEINENEINENEINENEINENKKKNKIKKNKVKQNVLKGGNLNSLLSTQEIFIILGLVLLYIIDTFARLGKKIY